MKLFGMITTAASRAYTPVGLRSFFAHTPLGPADRVLLIDNDADFELPGDLPADRITVVRQPAPRSFAQNANLLLAEARTSGADLYLLNNDLVFTRGWLEPLAVDRRSLLSPVSNAQVDYSAGGLTTRPAMALADYDGREADLDAIATRNRQANGGYRTVSSVAFFCVKIPRLVYETVGDFDEGFGKGGAEDRDYGVRAWLAGIPQELALGSYVLHFQGRSTWNGAETQAQIDERATQFTQAFQQKWGAALSYAFLANDWNLFRSDAMLARLLEQKDFRRVVERLNSRPSLDAFIQHQLQARVAAICVSPDLAAPIADRCHAVLTLETGWAEDAAQKNEGLRLTAEAGADYGLFVEPGSALDSAALDRAMALIRANPQVDCWPASAFPDLGGATIVRPGTGRFLADGSYEREPLIG